jgi:hypothetical protein
MRMSSGPSCLKLKPRAGIVELHRGAAEISQQHVHAIAPAQFSERTGQSGEVHAFHDERRLLAAAGTQPCLGAHDLDGVLIEREQRSAWLHGFQQRTGVAAVAERAIHSAFARLRGEDFHDLLQEDRHMLPGGRFTGRTHLRNGLGVALGVQLLVFVLKTTRILARVTRTAAMRRWSFGFAHSSLYLAFDPRAFATG